MIPLDLAPHPSPRVRAVHLACRLVTGAYLRPRYEGIAEIPPGVILAFNHLSWFDPFVVFAALPPEPRLYLFGPQETDMATGFRNRLIRATRVAVPFRPDRRDLVGSVRRVEAVLAARGRLAIAAEGRIHPGERRIERLSPGVAVFARRSGAPVVPLAINGTSWLAWRRPVRVRAGSALRIAPGETDAAFLDRLRRELLAMVGDWPDAPPPRWAPGRRLSELFNDWPGGRGVRPPTPDDDGVAPALTRWRLPEGGALRCGSAPPPPEAVQAATVARRAGFRLASVARSSRWGLHSIPIISVGIGPRW
jgi:1-acyl-sn-glycerol-3-phosphate acyltransferase